MIYEFILSNKEILKIVYTLIICFICAIIVLKTDRLFKLSNHQGIRYFRNAFFFYGSAFFVRFILGGLSDPIPHYEELYFTSIKLIFEFSIIMAGFFLFYSLIWKQVEKKTKHNSLLNFNIGVLYLVSIIITLLDFSLNTDLFMYTSQIILFAIMSVISYKNYIKGEKQHKFLKFYFIVMIIGLITWVLNTALFYYFDWNKVVQMQAYGLNIIFFLVFLYGIIKITKTKNG